MLRTKKSKNLKLTPIEQVDNIEYKNANKHLSDYNQNLVSVKMNQIENNSQGIDQRESSRQLETKDMISEQMSSPLQVEFFSCKKQILRVIREKQMPMKEKQTQVGCIMTRLNKYIAMHTIDATKMPIQEYCLRQNVSKISLLVKKLQVQKCVQNDLIQKQLEESKSWNEKFIQSINKLALSKQDIVEETKNYENLSGIRKRIFSNVGKQKKNMIESSFQQQIVILKLHELRKSFTESPKKEFLPGQTSFQALLEQIKTLCQQISKEKDRKQLQEPLHGENENIEFSNSSMNDFTKEKSDKFSFSDAKKSCSLKIQIKEESIQNNKKHELPGPYENKTKNRHKIFQRPDA